MKFIPEEPKNKDCNAKEETTIDTEKLQHEQRIMELKTNGVPIRALIAMQKTDVIDFMPKLNSIAEKHGLSVSVMAGRLLMDNVERYAKNETIPFDSLSISDQFGAMLWAMDNDFIA